MSQEEAPAAAAPLRSIVDIITDLSEPIAARHLKKKRQGTSDLTFIPWYHAVKYLDLYAPGWSSSISDPHHLPAPDKLPNDKKQQRGKVTISVSLSIPCLEGIVTRTALGIEDDVVTGYGDPTSNAQSMALRRAAAQFGLGLYLYNKEAS